MKYNLDLDFTCNKKTLEMNKNTDFRITSIQGIEASSYTIHKADVNGDGVVVTGEKIEPREITITGDITKNENETLNREELISFFTPKFIGELVIDRNNIKRKIQYKVESLSFPKSNLFEYGTWELSLLCPDPLWNSVDNYNKNIALITPQFAFPLVIPTNKGKIMGYRTYKNEAILNNDGDDETGLEITIIASRGEVINPKVELSTGEFIQLKDVTMAKGDVLKINTNKRQKAIRLNGNITNSYNRQSTFFALPVGISTIKYSSDEGYTNMDVNIVFYKKYLGV